LAPPPLPHTSLANISKAFNAAQRKEKQREVELEVAIVALLADEVMENGIANSTHSEKSLFS
jgi:hypothetical protein